MSNESRFPAWAWWIISVITILAVSILIFSVVLGIRAGQQQIEIQRRQQIGISLQQAMDLQADGNLQGAFEHYQKILVLDPSNDLAQQGIKNLLTLAASGTPLSAQPVVQAPPASNVPATTVAPTPDALLAVTAPATVQAVAVATLPATASAAATVISDWDTAQNAIRAGRWQEALNSLLALQQIDPTYRAAEVTNQLFGAYTSLAVEKDNEDNLEGALQLYEKALLLRPTSAATLRERSLIAQYLDVLTYTDVDMARTIELLENLYTADPQYRDVEQRLQDAHKAYGDELASDEQWCLAVDEYESALSVVNRPELAQKRDAAQQQCSQFGNVAATTAAGAALTATLSGGLTPGSSAVAPLPPAVVAGGGAPATGAPAIGRILYSVTDPVAGRTQIMAQAVGKGTAAQLLLPDAAQPAMRTDGARLAFRNLKGNAAGISSFDPDTGLTLRFTEYAEDSAPSWNPAGSRIVFASNREGDRLWRIFLVWAETNGGIDTLGLGEAPSWSPVADSIALRGCDQSGNGCGLWTMTSNGGSRSPLTTVPDDNRPAWAPDGSFVTFMSSGRDGNFEIYRVEVATRQVTRLTDSPAVDSLPTVSPDGEWVAFVSNRDGGWKLWAVPSAGGTASVIAPIVGDMSKWLEQGLQWTY